MPRRIEDGKTWEQVYEEVNNKIGYKFSKKDRPIFKKWFLYREKVGYLFDAVMILRCFRIWQEIERNLDHFIVISGREGYGKTTLSFAISAWVNPDGFSLANVCYGAKSYLDILSKKANTQDTNNISSESIVLDEGTELLSRESLNVTNRSLTKTFFVQRALKFLVIVNIPNFHMLDITIRNHRVRTLIEVTKRGKYKCICGKGIKIIAKEGQMSKQVDGVRIPIGTWWEGYFRKEFPIMVDREAYESHKIISIREMLETMKDDVVERKMVAATKVSKEIGCVPETIVKMIKRQEIEGKMISGKWYLTRAAYDKIMTV